MITAQKLTKRFGDIIALDEVNFIIEPGEFVFLIGPSGSGKTTLIRLVLREFLPTSGTILVGNQDISQLQTKKIPYYRRNIGVVFQDFKLLPDLNVWENIALPLKIINTEPDSIEAAVKSALDMVEIKSRSDLFPSQISGGELQRVVLARAIASRPKLLLADEPTGNLDPKTARSIVKLLETIHTELKTTVVIATHNADIVNVLNKRVISLLAGKIAKDSPKGKYE